MPTVTLYDPATGRIRMTAVLSADSHAMLTQDEEPRLEGAFDAAAFYVQDGAAIARQVNTAQLSGTTLLNLPSPCTITINGTAYPCTDASADLMLGPGVYAITVSAWPMLDATFNVRV